MISLNTKQMPQLNSYPAFRAINQPQKPETNVLQQNISFNGGGDTGGCIVDRIVAPFYDLTLGPIFDFVEAVKEHFSKSPAERLLSANPQLNKLVKEIINAPTDDAVKKFNEIIHLKEFLESDSGNDFWVSEYLRRQLSDSICKSSSEAKIKALLTIYGVTELMEKRWQFTMDNSRIKSIENKLFGTSDEELKKMDDAIMQVLNFKDEKLQQIGKSQIESWCSSKLNDFGCSGMYTRDFRQLKTQKIERAQRDYLTETYIPKLQELAKSCNQKLNIYNYVEK